MLSSRVHEGASPLTLPSPYMGSNMEHLPDLVQIGREPAADDERLLATKMKEIPGEMTQKMTDEEEAL